MLIKPILILAFSLTLASCGDEINLDKNAKIEIRYEDLSMELKEIYSTHFPSEIDSTGYFVFSLDPGYELDHYWTGIHKNLILRGFNHHFIINDKEFKLGANLGDPFVLLNKKLYYTTELNLDETNYKEALFISIDLTDYLSD